MNIIGVGQAGCAVAAKFEKMPQYKVFSVDTDDNNYRKLFKVEPQSSHEEYEANYKKINTRLINKEHTTLIVSGASKISGIILRLLEQLKTREMTVMYIKPDLSTSPKEVVMQEKIVFGVLQQYARSGKLANMIIVDNALIEGVVGDISIASYWDEINNVIASTYHMINVFNNTEPLLSTLSSPGTTSRICTLGVVAVENLDEKPFYDLRFPRLKKYFFGISENTLNEKKSLLTEIRSYLKERSTEECSACFAIYSTSYEQDYAYTIHYASFVQEEKI